jgi:hypothetical protein
MGLNPNLEFKNPSYGIWVLENIDVIRIPDFYLEYLYEKCKKHECNELLILNV